MSMKPLIGHLGLVGLVLSLPDGVIFQEELTKCAQLSVYLNGVLDISVLL